MIVNRLQQVSLGLKGLCTVSLLAMPALAIYAVASGSFDAEAMRAAYPDIPVSEVLPGSSVIGLMLTEAFGLALLGYVLWQVRGLLSGYAKGDVLTAASAHHLVRAGIALLVLAFVDLLTGMLRVLLLTWNNPVGQRQLSIGVSEAEIGFLLAGGLLLVVGWAMAEAAQHAAENREFI